MRSILKMTRQRIDSDPTYARAAPESPRVGFGPFLFDRRDRSLTRNGAEIELPDRSLRLLDVLVRDTGSMVSKERLIEEVWHGACVTDSSLTEAMSRLRGALGDGAREPEFIQTVHRRGYRFITPVRDAELKTRDSEHRGGRNLAHSIMTLAAALLLVTVAVMDRVETSIRSFVASTAPAGPIDFDPLLGIRHFLEGVPPAKAARSRPLYRLAEVGAGISGVRKYGVPALPLNGLSVDRSGRRLAFSIADGETSDAWVLEPARAELRRIATGGYFSDPVWSPDGESVVLASNRGGNFDLVLKSVDREQQTEVLLEAPLDQFPESWSRDGQSIVYSERHPDSGFDLWILRRQEPEGWTRFPLVRTPDHEAFGAVSPDGRTVAFVSWTENRSEVFVTAVAGNAPIVRVSHEGGDYPFWSANGDLLHFVRSDQVWTVASSQIDGRTTIQPFPTSQVSGLYLAGSTPSVDRMIVAMLD